MVITCPSCSARYRLNPEKIRGRGAKITCPKCSHIFVVFSEGDSKPGEPVPEPREARSAAVAPVLSADMPAEPEAGRQTAGDVLARRNKETTTDAFRAVGLDDKSMTSPSTTGKIRVVAPGPRKGRKSVTTIETGNALPVVQRPSQSEAAPAPAAVVGWEGPEPASASELDFREVGITTWKVKVAIGLIYDFSDIATLKKYLADKKVTEDDLISHDGKGWVRLGDIPDLERHFIDTWKTAKLAAGGRKDKSAPRPAAADASPGAAAVPATFGPGTLGSASGGYASQTGSHAAVAAGGTARAERAARRKEKTDANPASKMPWLLLAAVIVLAVAAWVVFGRPGRPTPVAAGTGPGPQPTLAPDIDEAERERIRREVREQVEAQRAALIAEQEESQAAADAEDATPILEPVAPDPGSADASRRAGLPVPVRDVPIPRAAATPTAPAPTAAGDTTVAVTATDSNGKMYFEKGRQQFATGNYGSAKTMLLKAVSKCPTCGDYFDYLGRTHQALGDVEAAADAFARAQALGVPVNTASP